MKTQDQVLQRPVATQDAGQEREFAEWLNTQRDADVSSVFHEIVVRFKAAQAAPAVPDGWIGVKDQMPPPGKRVWVWFRNVLSNGRTTCAFYAPKHTVNADHWEDGYDEDEQGNSWVPEGWWEDPVEGEECHHISATVEFWMPLPTSPIAAQSNP